MINLIKKLNRTEGGRYIILWFGANLWWILGLLPIESFATILLSLFLFFVWAALSCIVVGQWLDDELDLDMEDKEDV